MNPESDIESDNRFGVPPEFSIVKVAQRGTRDEPMEHGLPNWIFSAIFVVLTLIEIVMAIKSGGWGAIGIVALYGPAVHMAVATAAITSVSLGLPVKASTRRRQYLTIVCCAIASCALPFFTIMLLTSHGC